MSILVRSVSSPVGPLLAEAAAEHGERAPCRRCEAVPDVPAEPLLHCWFPTAHVAGKARTVFRRHGIEPQETVGRGLAFRFDGIDMEAVARDLEQTLSQVELEDTRTLRTGAGALPTPDDLARVESLARFVVTARSQWLFAILRERRVVSHFQPIVYADDPTRIHAHEALLRGVGPDGTLISPGALFESARGAGVLFQLDRAARQSAITCASRHGLNTRLFVNFAPSAIYDPRSCLRSTVAEIDRAGLRREDIVFEIVETERAHDQQHLRRILDYYRDAGFRIALDDVGAGYSSLNLVHLLRPDILKLDMNIVRDVHRDPYKARIAANLLDVATSLGIEALAEGIECEEELAWVREHGARYAQGFHIARPAERPLRELRRAA